MSFSRVFSSFIIAAVIGLVVIAAALDVSGLWPKKIQESQSPVIAEIPNNRNAALSFPSLNRDSQSISGTASNSVIPSGAIPKPLQNKKPLWPDVEIALLGLISVGEINQALMSINQGEEQLYSRSDMLTQLITLKEIHKNHVVLAYKNSTKKLKLRALTTAAHDRTAASDGHASTLAFDEKSILKSESDTARPQDPRTYAQMATENPKAYSPFPEPNFATWISRDDTGQYYVERETLKQQLNSSRALRDAQFTPQQDGQGVKLSQLTPGSFYELMGLKNGDVITAINGNKIQSPIQAMQFLAGAEKMQRFELELLRDDDVQYAYFNLTNSSTPSGDKY